MNTLVKSLGPLLAELALLAGCKKDLDTYYTPRPAAGFEILGTTNATFNTKYAPGETVPVSVNFNQPDGPAAVTVFQATSTDSAQISSYPVAGTFVPTTGLTAQVVPYVVHFEIL